jgi:flagellar FliJ protein
MKRFVWRLQRVLDIRTKEEQKARTELLRLTEKLAQAQSELLTWRTILEEIINSLAVENPKKRLGKQEFFMRYSAESDEKIKKLENKVRELELKQQDKIAEVLRLKKFKEGLEKLRAEAKVQFIKEQERLEQRQLDEGATISFVRKNRIRR